MSWGAVFQGNPVTRTWFVRWQLDGAHEHIERFKSLDAAVRRSIEIRDDSPKANKWAFIFVEHGRQKELDLVWRFEQHSWGMTHASPEALEWAAAHQELWHVKHTSTGASGPMLPPGFEGFDADDLDWGDK
jgi:hypothetical protein